MKARTKVGYEGLTLNYWSTHLGLLFKALQVTKGTVIEMGTGAGSTPFLNVVLAGTFPQRQLISLETSLKFLDIARSYENSYHSVKHVTSWAKWREQDLVKDISVVFVDHGELGEDPQTLYDERIESVKFYADRAEIVIVHDTDFTYFYKSPKWPPVVNSFKYVATDIVNGSATTALSNWIDVRVVLQPKLEIFKNVLYDPELVALV